MSDGEGRRLDGGVHIVLADGNSELREYMGRLLRTRWSVEAVTDGEAALAAIRRRRPALVLTDVRMPVLDGFGLLRAVRNDPTTRTIPVVMFSADGSETSLAEGLAAGADDYLIKPFSSRELMARVAAKLESHHVGTE
jgi:DNA-binding response OmpR family regulator